MDLILILTLILIFGCFLAAADATATLWRRHHSAEKNAPTRVTYTWRG